MLDFEAWFRHLKTGICLLMLGQIVTMILIIILLCRGQ